MVAKAPVVEEDVANGFVILTLDVSKRNVETPATWLHHVTLRIFPNEAIQDWPGTAERFEIKTFGIIDYPWLSAVGDCWVALGGVWCRWVT